MSDGFQFIDIVFFAMIAAFLVLRLRSVLGRRTGTERQRPEPGVGRPTVDRPDNVVELPDRRRTVPEGPADAYTGTPLAAGISQVRIADPSFSPAPFLQGARGAFEMIVSAYAAGDRATLRPLLANDVMANFEAAIDAREQAGEKLETELVSIKSADLDEVVMEGRTARVTVKLVSEQVNVVRDADGKVVDGDPTRMAEVTDLWTFARDTGSRDPNWVLVATRSPETED
ncbi:MAG: Tim44 domain-containing protein [Alphaproteobacteria bacterium]|nr:Tim44 domain-containing protein [Alphaproteobacteria bacterium]